MLKSGPNVYPIPLRPDRTVQIAGLPAGMTEAEAIAAWNTRTQETDRHE